MNSPLGVRLSVPQLFAWALLASLCRSSAFAFDLQHPGSDDSRNDREHKHEAELRTREMLCRQLTDEILRRLHRIAGLGDVLARLESDAVIYRAICARPSGTDHQHRGTGIGLANLSGDVAQRGVDRWALIEHDDLEVDALVLRIRDHVRQAGILRTR